MKDFYKEIDTAIKEYEDFKPYKQHTTEWISNRISWCWKFRKISETQMNDFCDRMIAIYEELI